MAFSSGTYSLVAGNPVVTGTTISSTWANNTLNDIATALSTCVLKDGTQTITASVPFAVGISVTTGITTPSTTFALANTTATTINFAGAATTLNVGAGAGATATFNFTTGIALNTDAVTTTKTTVTAFAGATTLLTIGGTGATAVVAHPGTLEATNSTTAAVTIAGGLGVAKKIFAGSTLTASSSITSSNGSLILATSNAPASAGAAGTTGTVTWDSGAIYVCVSTNTWKKVAIATW